MPKRCKATLPHGQVSVERGEGRPRRARTIGRHIRRHRGDRQRRGRGATGPAAADRLRRNRREECDAKRNLRVLALEDFEYLRHGDRGLKLRVFRPRGDGPFPAVIDMHGGAWCNGDLNECKARDEVLAASGLVAIALDFRHAADGYPTSLIDINYAIRWVKANAAKLGVRADRIGLCGQSSGGHLAMLAAMRPRDPRYVSRGVAGRVAGGGCDGAVRGDDLAGDQPAVALPPCAPRTRYRQSAGLGRRHPASGTTPTGRPRPTWPRAIRCWRWSAARKC